MNELNDMKKEYKEIEIPLNLKEKTLNGIRSGKVAARKRNLIKISKISGGIMAAAMISITFLANSSQSIAFAMEQIPIIGAITKVVTFRTYTDKTNNFEANINVPQIETDTDENSISKAAKKVNRSVEEYTDMLIEQYHADLEASEGEGYYGMETSYEVVTDTDKIFTLRIDTVVAMGGASNFSKFYHINKKTDSVFTIKDIVKEDVDYISVISEQIKSLMREQMENDENIIYFLESEVPEWDFKEIKSDQNFYFNENEDLVIVFDEYEVAPGYMGIVEITIPKGNIADILK